MKNLKLTGAMLLIAVAAAAAEVSVPTVPYDSLMDDRVSADGWIDREDLEYPGEFKNPQTGLTVSWGHDGEFVYLGVETRGKGWFGIGFGSSKMDESNILLGFYTEDTADAVNLVGKGNTHAVAATLDDLGVDWDIDFDDETGVNVLEVVYPLTWQGEGAPEAFVNNPLLAATAVPGLVAGDVFDLILAQNTKTIRLDVAHTQRASLKFQLEPIPVPADSAGN